MKRPTPPSELTPLGYALDDLRERLALTPTERIESNAAWVRAAETLRRAHRPAHGPAPHPSDARRA